MTTHRMEEKQIGATRRRFPAIYALCGASFVFVLFVAGMWAGSDLIPAVSPVSGGYDSRLSAAADIAGRNFPVVFALLSGIATLGLTSVVTMAIVAMYSGVLARVALHTFGTSWWWQYFPFAIIEIGGFTIAALAGLYPAAVVVRNQVAASSVGDPRRRMHERLTAPARCYWRAMKTLIPVAGLAMSITLLALVLEVAFAIRID